MKHGGIAASVRISSLLLLAAVWMRADTRTAEQPDKYQWLEDVSSPKSLAWVKEEDARSAKVLEGDPQFATLYAMALKVLESPDRLATPHFREGEIYNTWQDAQHVQGILRRTSLEDYLTAKPNWHTVLDYDALGKQDNQKWVQEGLVCLYPGDRYCLVALSAGGEDAQTMREFDLKTEKFVTDGFQLPHSKQFADWVDKDTLAVARDWGAGTMTTSGYPFVVKLLKRGQPLEQAKEIFRGASTDVQVGAATLHDGQGHHAVIFERAVSFFDDELSLLTPAGVRKLALPPKVRLNGLLAGRLIVTINEDWKPQGVDHTIAQGSVVTFDLTALEKRPDHPEPRVMFAPTAQEFAQDVAITKNHLTAYHSRTCAGTCLCLFAWIGWRVDAERARGT